MICDQAHNTEKNMRATRCCVFRCLISGEVGHLCDVLHSRPRQKLERLRPRRDPHLHLSWLVLTAERGHSTTFFFHFSPGRLTCSSGAAQEVNPNFVVAALVRTPDAKRIVRDFESTMHANVALSLGTRRFHDTTNICPLAWYTTWSPQRCEHRDVGPGG